MNLHALDTVGLALVLGVAGYMLARRLSLPPILFYLAAGMAAGPLGLDIVDAHGLGGGLLVLVEFAVAIILFEGGLLLSTRGFWSAPRAIGRLLSLTILLTAAGGWLLGLTLLGLPSDVALLFGVIVVVTGPSVIKPLLKSLNLPARLRALLHWESIWGDVIGMVLTAMALKAASVSTLHEAGAVGAVLLTSILAGAALGAAVGLLLSRIVLPFVESLRDEVLPGVTAFAAAIGAFVLADNLVEASGPITVAVAGFFLSHQKPRTLADIRHFKDQLSVVFIGSLFVLLSATVDPEPLADMWPGMLLTAVLLGVVVRPLAVFAALSGSEVPRRERAYLALVSPRGIISLAAAAYAGMVMTGREAETGIMLDAIFFVVLLSGASATLLGRPLARALGVTAPAETSGIILVGLNPFARALGRALSRHVPVVFFDPRLDRCRLVREEGGSVFCTDLLDEDIYEEAFSEGYGRLLCLSTNDVLNRLVEPVAARHLGHAGVWRAVAEPPERPAAGREAEETGIFPRGVYAAWAAEGLAAGVVRVEECEWTPERADATPLFRVTHGGKGVAPLRDAAGAAGTCICLVRLADGDQSSPSPGGSPRSLKI